MNRKKVNGPNKNAPPLQVKAKDECGSTSTDSFDMKDFATSSLTKKYSVRIHKNNADLMAELNNIMGDESDCEIVEPNGKTNGLNTSSNSSDLRLLGLNTTHSTGDGCPDDDLESEKQERILAWAQSQSQNLSMCVASVLSDHDYLSQELLLGIVAGNEENTELENKRKMNGIVQTSEKESNEQNGEVDSMKRQEDSNGDAATQDNEQVPLDTIESLSSILKQLTESRGHAQNVSLLAEIAKKAKEMGAQLGSKHNKDSENNSIEFSPGHSEPMEYYGGVKFSTQSSVEEPKESEGVDLLTETTNDLKVVDDIADRIKIDTLTIRNKLLEIEQQSETERQSAIEKLRENFGLLVEDMTNELKKIGNKLKSNMVHNDSGLLVRLRVQRSRSRTSNESSGEDNSSSESRRKLKRLKKRRRLHKSQDEHSDISSDLSTNFDAASPRRNSKDQPFVISQNIEDVMNGNANSNSANESIRKENDFLGFDDDIDIGIDIKQEAILNESISSLNQLQTSRNKDTQNSTETSNKRKSNTSKDDQMSVDENEDNDDKNAKENTATSGKDNVKPEVQTTIQPEEPNRAMQDDSDSDHLSSGPNLSDDVDDEDDEDIRKLCDLTSLTAKRAAPSNVAPSTVAPKVNGVVESKKPAKKVNKEDELDKFLANSDDTDKPIESDDEKSEREEITEEQFLKEQNEMLKEQLLQDSSESEMDSDSEQQVNGDGSDFNSDLDSDHSSNSERSLVEKFLASETDSGDRKGKVDAKNEEKPKAELPASANHEKPVERETKESPKKPSGPKNDVEIKDDDSDSDIEFDDGLSGSENEAPKKPKSVSTTVGRRVLSSIEKEKHIVIPSDDEDMSSNEAKQKRKSEADSSEKDEILDTTMFKTSKKDLTPNQLSRIIQSNRSKQPASRPSPECISVSSDDDFEEIDTTTGEQKDGNEDDEEEKKKRVARKLLRPDQLADDTKQAQKEESDRIKRLDKKNERLSQFIESQRQSQEESEEPIDPNEVILDFNTKKNEKIAVHPEITKHLKPHQVEGIKFMYDCCYGSVDDLNKGLPGSGCILAHCMGLGKTLQLITLLHTVICYPQLKTDKVLVICPKSTVMNWKEEIERWLGGIKNTRKLKLFHFPEQSDVNAKLQILRDWSECGKDGRRQAGCLLVGYEAFRVLVFYHNSKKSKQIYSESELKKYKDKIHKYLLDPGADLVVCDEGHMIKNQKSSTSMAVNQILTPRRIVLTGTPIQNNLKEYWSMVNFIKPSILGTEKEFANLYINPIKNGQHKDSSKSDIKHMKQRSYVLHKKLSKFVQRKEAALLKSFLPEKYEFVLFIPMTKVQEDLYEYFLLNRPKNDSKGKTLIPDYTVLRKIWTHPKVLENAYLNALKNNHIVKKPPPINVPVNDSDDDQPDDVYDSKVGEMSVTNDWWRPHLKKEDLETILPSNKLKILFEILKRCERNKEKCLIFSAFVAVLDVVEQFMRLINDQETKGNQPGLETFRGRWVNGEDYYRLDGTTKKNHRHSMITNFNDPKNERTRVFLISAKAGGQGINLIGANRVILLDTSWNPSNDQQNIFRVFRLGQKKVCYIYRLISLGTMEETVYSRSVTKQAMSCRVMDEQQIDRHYSMAELTELYTLTKPNWEARPTPNVPKDDLLAQLLMQFPKLVYKYHEHDSLLENKGEEELSEQEKNDAWALYEADVKRKNETNFGPYNNSFGMYPNYSGLGTYANPLFNNYSNLSGVSGLNYPYNMYSQYNPYGSDYNQMRFNDYSAFYNNLMNIAGPSMSNYNPSNSNLLSPTNSSSVSSPPPNMNNFPSSSSSSSSRNWMQSNASTNYANNLLSSLAQSSSSSKSGYSSYLNSLYNALGTPASSSAAANASTSKTPPLPMSTTGFDPLAYMQKQQMLNLGATSSSASTTPLVGSSSAQGPNAQRNPLLTKELLIPRNPTMANPKDMFNVPIPTSVITKSTTSPLSTITASLSGSSNEASKSSSKSPDGGITSTVDKVGNKSSKSPIEPQISVKNITAINNGSRESPDTTGNQANSKSANKSSPGNDVSSTVTVDSTKKTNSKTVTPVSSNMGIVYPFAPKPTQQIASTSKANATSLLASSKPKEKDSTLNPLSTSSNVILTKTPSQPMPAIIRKPVQMGATKANDPTNDAVAAINKNKALTVTARSVNSPAAKVTTPVSNSITVSPILNSANKSSGVTITPQPVAQAKTSVQGRTISPIVSVPVPIAITKTTPNQTGATTKSPTTVVKPTVLGSRNTNTNVVTLPKSTNATASSPASSARIVNNNQPAAAPSTQRFTPIVAQRKVNVLTNNKPANNSNIQVNRVQGLPQGLTVVRQKPTVNRPNVSVATINSKKRPNNETIVLGTAKRPRTGNLIAPVSSPGTSKAMNPLSGIRLNKTAASQPKSSQIVPVEIVELE